MPDSERTQLVETVGGENDDLHSIPVVTLAGNACELSAEDSAPPTDPKPESSHLKGLVGEELVGVRVQSW